MSVPKLRFKEFKGKWEVKKLEELLFFKNGINATKEQYGKGVKFINVMDIINNDFITHDNIIGCVDVTEKVFEESKVEYGDVLFQRSSETREEVGQTSVYVDKNKSATFGGFVIRGKKIGEYNPIFINFLLKTDLIRKDITDKSGGSTRYNVGQDTLKTVAIHLPSIPEQTKIADFFIIIDEKIAQLTQKVELLVRYKKGVMQQLFSQELRFKDDDGCDFPDWEDTTFGDITRKISDNRNKNLNDAKVYSITNSNGFVLQSEHFDRVVAGNDLSNYKIIKKNEFAYNPARINVGSVAHFKDDIGIISSLYVCFETTDDLLDSFLLSILELEYTKYQIHNFGEGGVRTYLWYDLFALIKCKIPSIEEQNKIASLLTVIDEKITQSQTYLETVKLYKQALIQQMFI